MYSVSLTFKCCETPAAVHSQRKKKKVPLGKSDPKIGFFIYSEKFCHLFLLETYLNKT